MVERWNAIFMMQNIFDNLEDIQIITTEEKIKLLLYIYLKGIFNVQFSKTDEITLNLIFLGGHYFKGWRSIFFLNQN